MAAAVTQTLDDELFGPVDPARTCGDCIACCVVTIIDTPELKKAAGVPCPHNTGSGCGVYETRPAVCRAFECGYKRIPGMPPEARPDRSGMMFTIEREETPVHVFDNLYFMASAARDPMSLRSPLLNQVLTALSRSVLPVYMYWNGVRTLIHPQPALASAIAAPGAAEPTARRWLERYAPWARRAQGAKARLPDGV